MRAPSPTCPPPPREAASRACPPNSGENTSTREAQIVRLADKHSRSASGDSPGTVNSAAETLATTTPRQTKVHARPTRAISADRSLGPASPRGSYLLRPHPQPTPPTSKYSGVNAARPTTDRGHNDRSGGRFAQDATIKASMLLHKLSSLLRSMSLPALRANKHAGEQQKNKRRYGDTPPLRINPEPFFFCVGCE